MYRIECIHHELAVTPSAESVIHTAHGAFVRFVFLEERDAHLDSGTQGNAEETDNFCGFFYCGLYLY